MFSKPSKSQSAYAAGKAKLSPLLAAGLDERLL
jgi:hypothetical protein